MVSLVSKRQQARHEKALQDLINEVPGNNVCADCGAPNPGWASWSLGTFICMRCASIHRKMGTHVSKVKSLSMDSWNADQVRTMKMRGNITCNQHFNPRNEKVSIPIDADEADAAIERHIRQKYELQVLRIPPSPEMRRASAANIASGSGLGSDDGPPLPPKPGRRFGFKLRSSSAVPRLDRMTPPISPPLEEHDERLPAWANKKSRVLGSTIGNSSDDFDSKLASLRDMGFSDNRINSTLLKAMNGDLGRTIEALVRSADSSQPPSGTMTPVSADSGPNGITVARRSTNPFDALDQESLPQRAVTMPVQSSQTFSPPTQPIAYAFHDQQQQPFTSGYPLETGFAALQVSQPATNPPNYNTNPYLNNQTAAGSAYMPSTFQSQSQAYTSPSYSSVQTQNPWPAQAPQYSQSGAQQWASQTDEFAPAHMFTAEGSHQTPVPQYQPPYGQANNNPFGVASPSTATSNPFQQPQPQSASSASSNPYETPFYDFSQQQQHSQQQPQQQPQSFQTQPQMQSQSSNPPQYTQVRHDRASILALYNQPAGTPPPPFQEHPQRSVTMPVTSPSGSMNPFTSASAANGGTSGTQNGSGPPADAFSVHVWSQRNGQ